MLIILAILLALAYGAWRWYRYLVRRHLRAEWRNRRRQDAEAWESMLRERELATPATSSETSS